MAQLRGLRELLSGVFQTKTSSLKDGQAVGWTLYSSSTHLVYWLVCYCDGFVYHISLAKRAQYQYWNTYHTSGGSRGGSRGAQEPPFGLHLALRSILMIG